MARGVTICMAAALAWVAVAHAAPSKRLQPQVVTVDGDDFAGKLVSMDKGKALFKVKAKQRSVALRDLLGVRFAEAKDLMAIPGQKVAVLADGAVIAARRITVSKGKVILETRMLGRVVVDMSATAALYLPRRKEPPSVPAELLAEIRPKRGGDDYLLMFNDKGVLVPATGGLESVDATTVRFRVGEKERSIRLSSVCVIQLARVPNKGEPTKGRLVGTDGTILPFASLGFDGSAWSVKTNGVGAVKVDPANVAEIQFISDRGVYLSDLEPKKVFEAGMFDVAFPHQKDRSTTGGPIRLDGKTHRRGLGMHSKCSLTYELGGKFEGFTALAGIDEAAGKQGAATLKLIGDGKELVKPIKLVAGAAGKLVRCSVVGVKTLEILVDFGDDGIDVGDHVVLAGARLVKP